jgi:hypothetical protein
MDYNSLYAKFVYIRCYFVDVRNLKYVLDRTSNLEQKNLDKMEIKKHLFRTTNFMGHEVVTVFVFTAVISI